MKQSESDSLKRWEKVKENIYRSTPVPKETPSQKAKRMQNLIANPEAWYEYYFPSYCSAKPAKFHKEATKRIINNKRWMEVRAWARGLSKSTRTMMDALYLTLNGHVKTVLLIGNTHDSAETLLKPYLINLESNQRIISDYGQQYNPGDWTKDCFTTLSGVFFCAIGAEESPRGTKNEAWRPDLIIIDDLDTDKDCRNPNIIIKRWRWVERALIPTVDIAHDYRIIFNGNIIAKDCCIVRAMKYADYVDIINIRDKHGKSTWPEKNSEKDIDEICSRLSFATIQQEYYNNPIREGSTFKDITWSKCPPLNKLKFVVVYGDPAPSNKENKSNCYKSVGIVGMLDGVFYIYNCRLDHVLNKDFVGWYYEMEEYIKQRTQIYNYLENNSLQDPFYQQVFIPLFVQAGKDMGHYIPVIPDERKKPDKFARIEGNLEPLNRRGALIFNIDEKDNPHMQRLEDQFRAVEPQLSAPVDGPDMIEGAVFILNQKAVAAQPIQVAPRTANSNKNRF